LSVGVGGTTATGVRLLAVGTPCGGIAGEGAAIADLAVRLGRRFEIVSPGAFAMWWQLLQPRTPEEICRWSQEQGCTDPEAALGELISAGAAVEWEGDARRLSQMRLITLGVGLGSAPHDPDVCLIGFGRERSEVHVDPASYTVWMLSDGRQTLEQVVGECAAALEVETGAVWDALGHTLPRLLAAGLAALEL
jgi:hypothetical protein